MCFSAEASFAVGGVLIPATAYCVRAAWVKNPRLVPLALMPAAFAAQQIAEGFVWLGLHRGDASQVRVAALVFLFFATAFWPFWLAFFNAIYDARPGRKRLFFVMAVLTTGWFWVLYYPQLIGEGSLPSVEIVHHSLVYNFAPLPVRQYVPVPVLVMLYLLSVAVPMTLGENMFGRIPIIFLLASVAVAAAVFHYAFVSVWCFLVAVLTSYLCALFYRLPATRSVELPTPPK